MKVQAVILVVFVFSVIMAIEERSLAIIFDGTGSMGKDLEQLKSAAKKIIDNLSMQERNHIVEYILVVYRDPDLDDPFITTHPHELFHRLDKIHVHGGGDCPEIALTGIESALRVARPKSFAFVFTDADAKDFSKEDDVVDLIRTKEIMLNIFVTGNCGHKFPSSGKNIYHNLTTHGRGQVLEITKDDVHTVVSSYIPQLQVDYEAILEAKYDDEKFNTFFIDGTMDSLNLRIAGNNPSVTVRDPHNNLADTKLVVDLPNLKVVEVLNPEKGKYSVRTKADSPYTLKVGGDTKIHFNYGFSRNPTNDISDLNRHIIEDSPNVFTVVVESPDTVEELTNILIKTKNFDGTDYKVKHQLKKISENVYQTNPIDFPETSFEIFVDGVDKDGDDFERFIKPVVRNTEVGFEHKFHEVIEGNSLALACGSSNGEGRAKKTWSFNDVIIMSEKSDHDKPLKLQLNEITRADAGKYECKIEGADDISVRVFNIRVVIKPSLELITNIDKLKIGSDCTLKCNYQSNKAVNLTWTDEKGKILSTNNQFYTFKVPKDIKTKKIICNVTTEDFNYPAIVSFQPQSSGSNIECDVESVKEWIEIGQQETCNVKNFPPEALKAFFSNGEPLTQVFAFSLNGFKIKDFPSNLNDILDTKLVAIECTDTKISDIHSENLKPYGKELKYIDLSDNSLLFIETNLFKFNTNLKVIKLANNNIAYVDGNVFDDLINNRNLVHATMSNNKCIDYDGYNREEVKELAEKIKDECDAKYSQLTSCQQ